MSEIPIITEHEQKPGLLSPRMLEVAGIPEGTFQFDYNRYVEAYEATKAGERASELERIAAMSEELRLHIGSDGYASLQQAYDVYVQPINQRWGQEFDDDLVNLLAALLIIHKDITFVVQPRTELFWFDRLKQKIDGIPFDQDEHFIEDKITRQANPGRPDADSIELHVYELPDNIATLRRAVLAKSVVLVT